jgi:MFS transporter, PAT family, beta-lactamase induction signal transducer AmpG
MSEDVKTVGSPKKPVVQKRNPWYWIPTLYFVEGLPYFAVNTISVLMFKKLGMSNTDIALYTGWLYLPWVIKPFWSPFVDILKTKRWWTVTMQLVMAVGLALVAFTIPVVPAAQIAAGNVSVSLFTACLAIFWLVAFSSATHDIAADGFYMLALDPSDQSLFVGIRSTFYRCASIFGQGVLVVIAGLLENSIGVVPLAWRYTILILAALLGVVGLYHLFILPHPASDRSVEAVKEEEGIKTNVVKEFFETFGSFFRKPQVGIAILFMLFFRLPEAQLIKLIQPFLVDPLSAGGLGLSTEAVGIVYGTVGVLGLTIGGIIGGICASRGGLRKWLWPMALSISLTCITFCYLSHFPQSSLLVVNICVFIEQFGYGFGFTAFMLFMMYFAEGDHKTSHYAICTAFMALGMMLPGMAAGWIEEHLGGYKPFFWWVFACNIATLIVTALIKVDPNYGKKVKTVKAAEEPKKIDEK